MLTEAGFNHIKQFNTYDEYLIHSSLIWGLAASGSSTNRETLAIEAVFIYFAKKGMTYEQIIDMLETHHRDGEFPTGWMSPAFRMTYFP